MFYKAYFLYETDMTDPIQSYVPLERCDDIIFEAENNKEAEESFYRWFHKQKKTNPRLYKKLLQVTIYIYEIHLVSLDRKSVV